MIVRFVQQLCFISLSSLFLVLIFVLLASAVQWTTEWIDMFAKPFSQTTTDYDLLLLMLLLSWWLWLTCQSFPLPSLQSGGQREKTNYFRYGQHTQTHRRVGWWWNKSSEISHEIFRFHGTCIFLHYCMACQSWISCKSHRNKFVSPSRFTPLPWS